jgi:hypothetical protein
MFNAAQFESAQTLYLSLAESISAQLDLEPAPPEDWSARSGPNINFQNYLRRRVLSRIQAPIVWALDEVDRLFSCSFGSEVFGLFRSWHNARSLDPDGPWTRLTLAIAYATEAHLFITDVNQSPFNVGTRLTLEDFTLEQLTDLNRRYGAPLRTRAEIRRFFRLVGGQPYLIRRGLNHLVTSRIGIGGFEKEAVRNEGIFADHLRRMLVFLAKNSELCAVVRDIIEGRPCAREEDFYRLRTAGVLAGDSAREARPRCELYATYLKHQLQ